MDYFVTLPAQDVAVTQIATGLEQPLLDKSNAWMMFSTFRLLARHPKLAAVETGFGPAKHTENTFFENFFPMILEASFSEATNADNRSLLSPESWVAPASAVKA
jgi:hypothetical protein